jgi:outer membrane protein
MKKSLTPLFALAASLVLALTVRAQPEPKILVVDIAKVFDNHYAKQTEEAKLRADAQKAEGDMQQLVKDGNDLVDQYKGLVDQSKNPALTHEAQAKADDDAKKKMDEITSKQNELNSFKQTVQRQFQERIQTIHNGIVSSITVAATNVAKRHGATLVLDKSGVSAFGAPLLIYSDPAYDITDEVITEVNKDRPPAPPASSSAAPGAPSADEPKLTMPSLAPTNP